MVNAIVTYVQFNGIEIEFVGAIGLGFIPEISLQEVLREALHSKWFFPMEQHF